MIKASALCLYEPIVEQSRKDRLSWLVKDSQDMVIESVNGGGKIPEPVADLALRLLDADQIVKDVIRDLRMLYVSRRDDFRISLSGKSRGEKEKIVGLMQDMYGIVSSVHYNPENETVAGRLSSTSKAQMFITGKYLEIAVYKRAEEILEKLAKKHGSTYAIYPNVQVSTKEGKLKNEFDLVLEFGGIFYVIEIKSGKNFREFDKYTAIGREYKIVPGRFLLVDNYLSDAQADTVEYFCDYYVSNLSAGSLEAKLIKMIEDDLDGRK